MVVSPQRGHRKMTEPCSVSGRPQVVHWVSIQASTLRSSPRRLKRIPRPVARGENSNSRASHPPLPPEARDIEAIWPDMTHRKVYPSLELEFILRAAAPWARSSARLDGRRLVPRKSVWLLGKALGAIPGSVCAETRWSGVRNRASPGGAAKVPAGPSGGQP
jgi:hypothetical protein